MDLIEASKQALDALESLFDAPGRPESGDVAVWRLGGSDRARTAIEVLREAINTELLHTNPLSVKEIYALNKQAESSLAIEAAHSQRRNEMDLIEAADKEKIYQISLVKADGNVWIDVDVAAYLGALLYKEEYRCRIVQKLDEE